MSFSERLCQDICQTPDHCHGMKSEMINIVLNIIALILLVTVVTKYKFRRDFIVISDRLIFCSTIIEH